MRTWFIAQIIGFSSSPVAKVHIAKGLRVEQFQPRKNFWFFIWTHRNSASACRPRVRYDKIKVSMANNNFCDPQEPKSATLTSKRPKLKALTISRYPNLNFIEFDLKNQKPLRVVRVWNPPLQFTQRPRKPPEQNLVRKDRVFNFWIFALSFL